MNRLDHALTEVGDGPMAALGLTLLAYLLADRLYRACRMHPLLNPVLLTSVALVGLLWLTGWPYHRYFDGARYIHLLLGPAVVALAVPLHRALPLIREAAPAIGIGLLCGAIAGIASAIAVAGLLGAPADLVMSLAPKSATAPVAMAIAADIGGIASLAAALAVLTGIAGAMFGGWALDLVRIRDPRYRGFAVGLASHGIGTARMLQVNATAGAFAGAAMGLNALATALLAPALFGAG